MTPSSRCPMGNGQPVDRYRRKRTRIKKDSPTGKLSSPYDQWSYVLGLCQYSGIVNPHVSSGNAMIMLWSLFRCGFAIWAQHWADAWNQWSGFVMNIQARHFLTA
jgi:hypothetical protein